MKYRRSGQRLLPGFKCRSGSGQSTSEACDFRGGASAIASLNGLGQRRQHEWLVCRPGRVDEMLEPGSTFKARWIKQRSFNFHERLVNTFGARLITGLDRAARRY